MSKRNENRPGYRETKVGWIPEHWKVKSFSEMAVRRNEKFDPTTNGKSYKCIELEHINRETGQILGFVEANKQASSKNIFYPKDVLFGKLRPYLRKFALVNFKGVCSSEIWVLKNRDINTSGYLYLIVQSSQFIEYANKTSGTKMPRAEWGLVSGINFPLPPIPEQIKITEILSTWDKAIEMVGKQIEAKQILKKGLMQKLLTGKTRFKDFTSQWRAVKLCNLFSERNENDISLELLSITANEGVIPRDDVGRKDTSNVDKSNYKVIKPGDIGYNTMRMWQGRSAVSKLLGIVSPAYTIVTPKTGQNVDFYGYLFK